MCLTGGLPIALLSESARLVPQWYVVTNRFGHRFINREIKWPTEYQIGASSIPIHAHATLTQCFSDLENEPYPQLLQRRQEIIAFLHKYLDDD